MASSQVDSDTDAPTSLIVEGTTFPQCEAAESLWGRRMYHHPSTVSMAELRKVRSCLSAMFTVPVTKFRALRDRKSPVSYLLNYVIISFNEVSLRGNVLIRV